MVESQVSGERLVMITLVLLWRSRWRKSFSKFLSASDSNGVTSVPSMPLADSKLSHTRIKGCFVKYSQSASNFCSSEAASAPPPDSFSTMWLMMYSTLRISSKENQKTLFCKPSVCCNHCRKPCARVVLPTPAMPWIRRPAWACRCNARSSAWMARSRPMKP